MFWSKTLILSVILSIGGASAQGVKRIIGGNEALIQHYPYQVSLRVLNSHFCGGSIISESHVLTAAHCINKYMTAPFRYARVVTGTSYRDRAGQAHRIAKIDVHPAWRPVEEESYPNDLAVITLRDKIVFDEYQQKIDLPSYDFEDGHLANVTGWGFISEYPDTRPRQLQSVETRLMSHDTCQKKIAEPDATIHDTQLCAFRSRGIGPCSGDSGGPLAVDGQVVGVVSWVAGDDCAAGKPEVYTNVYKYKPYINSILKDFK